ncbi:MAG: polysaccharide deacetylase family protein [Deltaproteobacteria bacterium]|jgi:hypothetical protein|nr:polysaccharide deacetylase family protein [Deltaproteobacteria bacterium]
MTGRSCAVSIDLDSLACYYQIHGLGPAPEDLEPLIIKRCVPRFLELFEERGIRATFFVVGRDLDLSLGPQARAARSVLGECLAAGHELGNHSYSHPYEMARLTRSEVAEEIARAHELLSELGADVVGFRAPGYDLSPTMLQVLDDSGYLYDSSVFPAPGYYAAKLAVMAALKVTGRKSGAVVTNPLALTAPVRPYRPSLRAPWRRGHSRLVELPIAVTPGLRLPAIGTSLLLAPAAVRDKILDGIMGQRFFNFELHGIDLADADADGIPGELVRRQPDLGLSYAEKRNRLAAILDRLADRFEFNILAEVAEGVQARV